ncbi:MAG: CHAT domain-containing protein [Deltaproteobacteria bacterium]|nr:CHAT domain-containing protein [Deltaproteobacteria bacterium]
MQLADLRLSGAATVLERGDTRVYVFDDAHPPELSVLGGVVQAGFEPLARADLARRGAAEGAEGSDEPWYAPCADAMADLEARPEAKLVVTATRAAGARVRMTLGTSTTAVGWVGTLSAGGHRFNACWAPTQDAWPQLAEVRALEGEDDAAAVRLVERLLTVQEGLPLLAAHVERLRLIRRTDMPGYEEGLEAWAEAARAMGARNIWSQALRAQGLRAFVARDFSRALARLDEAEGLDTRLDDAVGLARGLYYRSLMLSDLGRYREALDAAERALDAAHASGVPGEEVLPAQARVGALLQVGRYEEAWRTLEEVKADMACPGLIAALHLATRGWVLARAMTVGVIDEDWPRVEREMQTALHCFPPGPGASAERAGAYLNLAYFRLVQGDLTGCRAELRRLEHVEGEVPAHFAAFVANLEGQLDLRESRPEAALRAFQAALERSLAESAGVPSDATWQAHHGLANAAAMVGDHARAHLHYRAAVRDLEQVAQHTHLAQDRAGFIDDRHQLFVDAVRFFVRQGDLDDALVTMDQARAVAYATLRVRGAVEHLTPERRAAWRRSLDAYDELRGQLDTQLREQDLLPTEGKASFIATTRRLRSEAAAAFDRAFAQLETDAELRATPTAEVLRSALAPHQALLVPWTEGTEHLWLGVRGDGVTLFRQRPIAPWWSHEPGRPLHLYVATMGAEQPWAVLGGEASARAWLERGTVSFLPFPSALPAAGPATDGAAVVIADPGSNLPLAREEARAVTSHVARAELLVGPAATREATLSAIEGASLFHFAGHGVLDAADPWSAHLALAHGERLTLEDVFAARPRAQRVVLSGCSTGQALAMGRHVRLSLPEAFLATGSASVVATTRAVTDAEARDFFKRFYDASGATRPVQAFREVALTSEAAAWSAYYVVGREQ